MTTSPEIIPTEKDLADGKEYAMANRHLMGWSSAQVAEEAANTARIYAIKRARTAFFTEWERSNPEPRQPADAYAPESTWDQSLTYQWRADRRQAFLSHYNLPDE